MQKAGVTGLSVAVLNDARVVYSRRFGWKDRDAGTTLDDATVFGAGSLSKTVFAYVVLLLAKDGIIDLDKPLQQYLSRPLAEYPRYVDLAGDHGYGTQSHDRISQLAIRSSRWAPEDPVRAGRPFQLFRRRN